MPNKPGGVFAGSDTTDKSMLPLSVWNDGCAAEDDDDVASQETAPSAATDTRSSTTDRGPDSVD